MCPSDTSGKFQLVIEFQCSGEIADVDKLVAVESALHEMTLKNGFVDGHDVGGRIFNIFVITTDPKETFNEIMKVIIQLGGVPSAAAFRDIDDGEYVRVWPLNDTSEFHLK